MIAAGGVRLVGLPPVVSPATRLLVLGSFPGARSLAEQQYYAHPRNQFWRILSLLWNEDLVALPYADRLAHLQARGLGLWDVYASCERQGSLDTAIRAPQVNDFAGLARCCPLLEAVAHNGGESFRHARHSATLAVSVHRLPSTSPAHAAWSLERKCEAWADVFRQHHLFR
ncbi:DNA-deoxyinosine glycosylase [uncultured Xylophilus sp.]|uniref:DNA-deoxyinosine glycosylase n=1 Tax=uncultured Xylophilus sp. TaxID=296832 RepID=UPI0025DEA1CB|nr:DNA-deoxyinosine glycosylase [uncultured Xylophilus sp.]